MVAGLSRRAFWRLVWGGGAPWNTVRFLLVFTFLCWLVFNAVRRYLHPYKRPLLRIPDLPQIERRNSFCFGGLHRCIKGITSVPSGSFPSCICPSVCPARQEHRQQLRSVE